MELNLDFDRKSEGIMKAAKQFVETEKPQIESILTSANGVQFDCQDVQVKQLNEDRQLEMLIKKIAENINLYCELEALFRHRDVGVVATELKLLLKSIADLKNIHLLKECSSAEDVTNVEVFDNDPLFKWYLIFYQALNFNKVSLVCSPSTSSACYLFVQHLNLAGYDVKLKCVPATETSVKSVKAECLGVITEKSDVDSAVDVFLAAPVQCHWGVRRLFIQESAYARFKNALTWKCDLKEANVEIQASHLCSEVHFYENKAFLLDFAGSIDQIKETTHVVLVEAFRTVKELLALIEKDSPSYLSVWSSDISEANEIAYTAKVPVVWINDYAVFNGPFNIAKPFGYDYFLGTEFTDKSGCEKLSKSLQSWNTLDVNSRMEKIIKFVEAMNGKNEDEKREKANILSILQRNKQLKSVEIDSGRIWVYIESPKGLIGIRGEYIGDSALADVLMSLAFGNGVISIGSDSRDFRTTFLQSLERNELPVSVRFGMDEFNEIPSKDSVKVSTAGDLYNVKTVCTNFGNVFAN